VMEIVKSGVLAEVPILLTKSDRRKQQVHNLVGAAASTVAAILFALVVFLGRG